MTLEERIASAICRGIDKAGADCKYMANKYNRERLARYIAESLRSDFLISPGEDDLTQVEALLKKLQRRRIRR